MEMGFLSTYGNLSWLIVMIFFLILEAAVPGLVSIWFAGGALIAFLLGALGAPLWLQILVFLAASLAFIAALRPLSKKYFNKDRTKTNAQSVVGKKAIVKEPIDNLNSQGMVTVDGMDWTARADSQAEQIPAGETVEILRIEGVKLIVKRTSENIQNEEGERKDI